MNYDECLLIKCQQKATGAEIHNLGVITADYKCCFRNIADFSNEPDFDMAWHKAHIRELERIMLKFLNTGILER